MPIAPPENPTEDDLKAITKFIIQQSYSDGVGSLTLERSEDGFTGQFSDRTDTKKILQYDLSKSGGGWQLNYKALSGVEDISEGDFSETETEPIWNETPFDFEEYLDFAASTKEKKCKTGTPCGKSCISASKTCKTKPAPDVKEKITAVKEKLKKVTPKKPKAEPKPKAEKKATPKKNKAEPISKTSIVTDDDYEVSNSPSSGRFVSAKASAIVSYGKENHVIQSTVRHAPDSIADANGIKNSYSYEFRIDGDTLSGKVKNDAMKLSIGKTLNKQFKRALAEIPEGAIVMNEPEVDDGKGASRAKAYEKHGFSKAYTFEVGGHSAKPVQYAIKSEGKLIPWKPSKMPKQVKKFKEAVF